MNWTNETIQIDFPIPSGIQRVIEELERADCEKDFGAWFNYVDYLDLVCKKACGDEKITQEQWDVLCSKYTLDRCFEE